MYTTSSSYTTLAEPSKAIVREKMSRFIAMARPIDSAAQARAWISDVANQYHDARHVCWAYITGADQSVWQCSDNGEPSGTAGRPILGQIRSAALSYVAVVVVRYFGGIKLGTSGLIQAYREASRQALDQAPKVQLHELATITATHTYVAMNAVMRLIKDSDARVLSQECNELCTVGLQLPAQDADATLKRLTDIEGVTQTTITYPENQP